MEPIDKTLLPLTSLISDLFGTNKHHRFDGNFSKISVVMTDAVEPLSTKKFTEKL
jgi:imidazoleglycerol phosphate dehydratase HisB